MCLHIFIRNGQVTDSQKVLYANSGGNTHFFIPHTQQFPPVITNTSFYL